MVKEVIVLNVESERRQKPRTHAQRIEVGFSRVWYMFVNMYVGVYTQALGGQRWMTGIFVSLHVTL